MEAAAAFRAKAFDFPRTEALPTPALAWHAKLSGGPRGSLANMGCPALDSRANAPRPASPRPEQSQRPPGWPSATAFPSLRSRHLQRTSACEEGLRESAWNRRPEQSSGRPSRLARQETPRSPPSSPRPAPSTARSGCAPGPAPPGMRSGVGRKRRSPGRPPQILPRLPPELSPPRPVPFIRGGARFLPAARLLIRPRLRPARAAARGRLWAAGHGRAILVCKESAPRSPAPVPERARAPARSGLRTREPPGAAERGHLPPAPAQAPGSRLRQRLREGSPRRKGAPGQCQGASAGCAPHPQGASPAGRAARLGCSAARLGSGASPEGPEAAAPAGLSPPRPGSSLASPRWAARRRPRRASAELRRSVGGAPPLYVTARAKLLESWEKVRQLRLRLAGGGRREQPAPAPAQLRAPPPGPTAPRLPGCAGARVGLAWPGLLREPVDPGRGEAAAAAASLSCPAAARRCRGVSFPVRPVLARRPLSRLQAEGKRPRLRRPRSAEAPRGEEWLRRGCICTRRWDRALGAKPPWPSGVPASLAWEMLRALRCWHVGSCASAAGGLRLPSRAAPGNLQPCHHFAPPSRCPESHLCLIKSHSSSVWDLPWGAAGGAAALEPWRVAASIWLPCVPPEGVGGGR